jgi:HD-like signal output (HDOD) protein
MSETSLPTNVVVVGGEQELFDALLGALPALAPYWHMQFAADAATAERLLADNDDIDTVIVHARLSDGLGLTFLETVRSTYPQLARVFVAPPQSSLASQDLGLLAHEVIRFPFDVTRFVSAVQIATALQRRISDPALHALLGEIDALPSPPKSVLELNEALRNPDVEVAEIARIVDTDVAVTAKLLRVVNSAFFGLGSQITDTGHAVAYLGVPTVRTLVGSLQLLNSLQTSDSDVTTAVEDLQSHSLAVADLARSFLPSRQAAQDAYVAGMMHDVGLLALVSCAPVRYLALREEVLHSGRSLMDCELDVVGATHAIIGAYVLGLWGFPSWLVEAVARSHDADSLAEWSLDVTSAVFVAEQVVNCRRDTASWEGGQMPSVAYLEAVGLSSHLTANFDVQSSV